MNSRRAIEIEVGASEDATTTFVRDQLLLLRCAQEAVARARIWRRGATGLLLGRFHRADPASCAWECDAVQGAPRTCDAVASNPGSREGGLSRRLSGGRIVPVGSGVLCITMAVPLVNWLEQSGAALRPDQVLNRALRPLLALLRGLGVDAFYPGRDLLTVGGRTIAHASFTVMRDGVAVVEMQVAELESFANLPTLLDRFDPVSIAGVDRGAQAGSTSLVETGTPSMDDAGWARRFADAAAKSFGCEATVVDGAAAGVAITPAHESAARDFLLVPGPLEDGVLSAAAVSMLGVVECSARMRGDRLTGLRMTGDLIAPFHTLDDIAAECEGEPFRAPNVRKALARAMARPRSFVLGLRELDELILRLA